MKKVILSFDYELFFGIKSGTVQKTLIEPTYYMLDAMDQVGAKATYFVDYLMLKCLKATGTKRTLSDLSLIEEQLLDILKRGHRIELHIHSHWLDAKYNGDGTWDFSNFTHYSLSSLSKEKIEKMFIEGVKVLTSIARRVFPDYKIIAFRAGGWAIQPFENLKGGFKATDIFLDSSLGAGIRMKFRYSSFDFTKAPISCFYKFEDAVDMIEDEGHFCEIPISTYYLSFHERVINKIYRIINRNRYKKWGDGTHKCIHNKGKGTKNILMFTLTSIMPCLLIKKINRYPLDIITFIDHPKDTAPSNIELVKEISSFVEFTSYYELASKNGLIK